MRIILYSTGCDKCNTLKRKLEESNVEFEINNDVSKLPSLGFKFAPVLQTDEEYLDFSAAINWLRERTSK